MKKITALYVSIIITAANITGCAKMNRDAAEREARGTIEAGGYTWEINAESKGGNTIMTQGMPSQQNATDASDILCSKNDRVAQYVSQQALIFSGRAIFKFNCVR